MSVREVWMPVPDYDGLYEASNLGAIRRVGSDQPLIQVDGGNGYLVVSLSRDGVTRMFRVHRIILTAFCGAEPFDGAVAAHNDGIRSNCQLTNLRWATPIENQADRKRHGTHICGADVFGAKLTDERVREIRALIAKGYRGPQIAKSFGVSVSTIHLIRNNRIWRHVA
ncbi:HNH endonuclease [Sphingobium sp. UBA5915]|uniref:HNH endonuclease n=1 Tax=Sphingobium sp. UBA5915 TaxID=1947530 RepID=UPI0025DB0910|nr:HNH endonuclease [Sphingobium sp. UBA5915]